MTKKELMKRVNFKPQKIEHREPIEYSSKLTPYVDKVSNFALGPIVNGKTSSNVLGESPSDAAALAMCKDAK